MIRVIDIKKKCSGLSAPVKASIIFTVSSVIQKGIGFITTPIFTRMMTTEEYGVYSLYLSWYSILIILSSLGLTIAYNNALIQFENEEKKVISSFLGISTVITASFFGVFCVNRGFWEKLLGLPSSIITLMIFQCLVEPAFYLWSTRERFYYKYKKIVALTLIIAFGSPVLGVIMVYLSRDKSLARVLSNVIIVGIVDLCIYISIFAKGKKFYYKEYWKFGLSMCLPLIPHFLSQTMLNQSDRIMINKMVGGDKTAIYSVAYTIAAVVSIVITSINNSLLPYMYRNLKEHNLQMKRRINELIVLVGFLCFIIMLLGPEFIQIVGGVKYKEAIWVIPSITVGTYFSFVYSVFANVEYYYEKTKYMSIGSIIVAIVNIALNYALIPVFGYMVAGYTTLVGYILLTIFHFFFYRIVIRNEEWIEKDIIDIRFSLMFSIFMLATMLVVLTIYNNSYIRYLTILAFIAIALLNIKKLKIWLKKFLKED